MIKTRSDSTQVWVTNASAIGGGPGSTSIVNSAGWVVNIGNSAGWVVSIANTVAGGDIVNISNSAGWIVNVANTGGSVVVSNTQTAINIINSAGWIFAQSNTSPLVSVQNSAGGIFAQSNTSPLATITNSAGWIVSVANTLGVVAISNTSPLVQVQNTANWIVYTIDSRPTGTAITLVPSTAGQVLILASNALRRGASIYNQSTNPLYIRLGSTVSATTYSLMIVSSGYYEVPNPAYTGIITGLWTAANGQAVVTEAT